MCGIVGYVGRESALPFLLEGLRTLEYRGYDSAGIALVDAAGVTVRKGAGRIEALVAVTRDVETHEPCGIGHTRWATHGPPSDDNAHPHTDCVERIAVVHNGIIENYRALRTRLQAEGHQFLSETDTEVIPHLLESHYAGDLVAAARTARQELTGAYAFLAVSADDPLTVVAVREASPLVIGLGDGVNYIASDLTALLAYTRSALVLDNGELARVTPTGVTVFNAAGDEVTRAPMVITWNAEQASKGGHAHFMMKEIREQPDVWADCLQGRISPDGHAWLEELVDETDALRAIQRIQVVAAGTAYHAGLAAVSLLEHWTGIPVAVDVASEFRYREPLIPPGTLVLAVSQSGETADTLAGTRLAAARGAAVWAITNVVGSTLAREAARVLYTRAGPEIAVASTKAYTTQLLMLTLLAYHVAGVRGGAAAGKAADLLALPLAAAEWLNHDQDLPRLGAALAQHDHIFYVGRGIDYALSLEGQLKLKEISYIHAEAYPAGELKHGPLALIEPGMPVVATVSHGALVAKTVSNLEEVKARGARVLAVAAASVADDLAPLADDLVLVPDMPPAVMPALMALPLQLLAYYAAAARGVDVDKPRNLAKSVTVE